MELQDLLPFGIILIVLSFVFVIGQQMLGSLEEGQCDYTYLNPGDVTTDPSLTLTNPVTSGKYGCCTTWNGTVCSAWTTSSYGINVSVNSQIALDEASNWTPTIAQVVVAGIIIGILITALSVKLRQ